jgi:hypothetical protein
MASDPGGAVSDLFGAFGSLQAASAYGKASKLAANNAAITRASTAITQQQEARTITQALGAEDAAVAGAGLQQSGTALDLMRSSVQQSSLAKQLITNQGEITATSYDQQSAAYKAQEKGANTQAMGQGIGGVLKMVGWIICTELVRQGRMPKRWYVGGLLSLGDPECTPPAEISQFCLFALPLHDLQLAHREHRGASRLSRPQAPAGRHRHRYSLAVVLCARLRYDRCRQDRRLEGCVQWLIISRLFRIMSGPYMRMVQAPPLMNSWVATLRRIIRRLAALLVPALNMSRRT